MLNVSNAGAGLHEHESLGGDQLRVPAECEQFKLVEENERLDEFT